MLNWKELKDALFSAAGNVLYLDCVRVLAKTTTKVIEEEQKMARTEKVPKPSFYVGTYLLSLSLHIQ